MASSGFVPKVYKPQVQNLFLKAMFYGPPGVGKTTLAASASACELTSPVLFINVESGLLSISDDTDPITSSRINLKNIDVVDYESIQQLQDLCIYLIKERPPYKTIIMDSLSDLQVDNIENIVKTAVGSNAKRQSMDEIWQDDYGKSTSQIRRMVRAFRDLPLHFIACCHDATTTTEGYVSVHPALTPKLRQSVIGYMDIVGYMFTKENDSKVVRNLLTQPVGKFIAKDRSPGGKLGNIMEDPTIDKIMHTIVRSQ